MGVRELIDWVVVDVRDGHIAGVYEWLDAKTRDDAMKEMEAMELESGDFVLQQRTTWVSDKLVVKGGQCWVHSECIYLKGDVRRDMCLACGEPKEQK